MLSLKSFILALSLTLPSIAWSAPATERNILGDKITKSNQAVLSLPTATDTLVGRASNDTLTNKTYTIGTASRALQTGAGGNLEASSTISTTELGFLDSVTSALCGINQSCTLTNKTYTIGTASRALQTDGSGNLEVSATIDTTELGFLNGVTSSLCGINQSCTLTAKTLTAPALTDYVTATETTDPATPSAGTRRLYAKSDGFYQMDSTGTSSKVGSGSGGGINYIDNPDAESNTTGWNTYADAAGNVPVDCTGGTATGLTFARTVGTDLRDTAFFSMTQANSTSLQGKGVSYDFTIDKADQANLVYVTFDYLASSTFIASNGTTAPLTDGTTSTNAGNSDLEWFVYDVTNGGTPKPLIPQILTANGANSSTFSGYYQAAPNSVSYRICGHVATASANATGWVFKFDNVKVGPDKAAGGTAPARLSVTGDPASATVGNPIIFPTVTYDTTAGYNSTTGRYTVDRTGFCDIDGWITATANQTVSAYVNAVSRVTCGRQEPTEDTGAFTCAVKVTAGDILDLRPGGTLDAGTGSVMAIKCGDDSGGLGSGRPIVMQAIKNAGSFNNAVITGWTSVPQDSHAMFNATTGIATIPEAGTYRLTSVQCGSANNNSRILKNGSDLIIGNDGFRSNAVVEAPLLAGDQISTATAVSTTLCSNNTGTIFSISKIQGPSNTTATVPVVAQFGGDAASAAQNAVILWPTVYYDSHNAYSTSTGLYTCQVSGKYRWHGFLNSSAIGANSYFSFFKNGVDQANYVTWISTTTGVAAFSGSIPCVAGDTISIRNINATFDASGANVSRVNVERFAN